MINYHEDLGPLRKHCPALEDLDTRQNPWNKVSIASYNNTYDCI